MITTVAFEKKKAFDEGIIIGSKIEARWTNCHHYYVANATVVAINPKTFRVSLSHHVPILGSTGYSEGRIIKIPRFDSDGYSENNGAFPCVKPDEAMLADYSRRMELQERVQQKMTDSIRRQINESASVAAVG